MLVVSDMQQSPGPFVVELALRWGDMDSFGHVNNVQFARLFEEARIRAMTAWIGDEADRRYGMVVAHQEIEFVAPLYYSTSPARCEVVISRIGEKSFDYGCRLTAADGTVGALSETTLTVLDLAEGRAAPIPPRLREILETHLGDPVPFRRRR